MGLAQLGSTTTKRRGSTPSDSELRPAAATASCTTFRSNGVIGSSDTGSPVVADLLHDLAGQLDQPLALLRPEAGDVQHQPRPITRLAVDRQPGQLLESVEHLAVATHQLLQVRPHDRDRGTVALDVDVQVAVEIGDVEQLLEIVGGNVAFLLEVLDPHVVIGVLVVVGLLVRRSWSVGSSLGLVLRRPRSASSGSASSTTSSNWELSELTCCLLVLLLRFVRVARLSTRLGALGAGLLLRLLSHGRSTVDRLLRHGLDDPDGRLAAATVPRGLRLVAVLLGLEGRSAGRRVVADHVELLAHRPQVRGGPVEEDADREGHATEAERHRAGRRAGSSAAVHRDRSARRPACSCASAGAGW